MKKLLTCAAAVFILTTAASVTAMAETAWTYDDTTKTITITGSGAITDGDPWSEKLDEAKHIVVSDGFTSIGENVFFSCGSVEDISLPDGLTSIADHAFALSSNLRSVDLPSSLTKIGTEAFADCTSLTDVTIPKSLASLDAKSFSGCSSLTAYSVDPENTSYKAIDGVVFSADGATLVAYPAGAAASEYTVPDGTTSIAANAFANNANITAVIMPDSVSTIADRAFFYCSKLSSITFGSGLKTIGTDAFYGNACKTITIPSGTTTIGAEAFTNSKSLTLLDIPSSVTSIAENIVYGTSGELAIGCYGSTSAAAQYASKSGIKTASIVRVFVNGKELVFDSPATIINDCTMVPMRMIFEALGVEVSWDDNTKTAVGVKDGTTVSFKIGDDKLTKNGQYISLEAPAVIVNERTLVHVRAIAEAFGADVTWDGTNGIVNITG